MKRVLAALSAAALSLIGASAHAQQYPQRAVTVVVPFAAGGAFASTASIEITSVAYKGNAPALADILGGQIQAMFDQSNTALPHVRAQKLLALGITSRTRLSQMPDVPTFHESGFPGFEAATWYGIYAPRGTPRAALDRIHAQFTEAMQDKAFTSRLAEEGYFLLDPAATTGAALASHTRAEIERWKKVIVDAKIPVN